MYIYIITSMKIENCFKRAINSNKFSSKFLQSCVYSVEIVK